MPIIPYALNKRSVLLGFRNRALATPGSFHGPPLPLQDYLRGTRPTCRSVMRMPEIYLIVS
jgi:hypothetical protein